MFNLTIKQTLILALSATMLAGCGAAPTQSGGWSVKQADKQIVELAAKTGDVQIAFPGLSAYKTLATTNDIERVRLTLSSAMIYGGPVPMVGAHATEPATLLPTPVPTHRPYPTYTRTIELKRSDLVKHTVKVLFDKVPTGYVTLRVQALDKVGEEIGAGTTGSKVAPGQTTQMSMAVRLRGSDTGNVAAAVTFLDGEGETLPVPMAQ